MQKLSISVVIFSVILSTAYGDRKQDVLFAEYGSFGSKADFYSETYLNGMSHTLETNGPCKNLPRSWQGKALSMDTKGTCVKVCDEQDCKGTCKYVYPAHGEQQLSEVGMAKKVVSAQGCFQNRN